MMKPVRQKLLLLFVALCLLLSASAQDTVRFRQWLDAGLYPLQTLEPVEGFTDLDVLEEMVGESRIVALGEQSFGDANSLKAKVRIARFLMENMGFNQIVFENGIYDLFKADLEMKAGRATAEQAMQNSILPAWWESAEFAPLTEYLQSRLSAGSPVTVAGMDVFHNGTYATENLVNALGAFLDRAAPPGTFRDTLLAAMDVMFSRMETWPQWPLQAIGPSLFLDKGLYPPLFDTPADSARFFARDREIIRCLKAITGEPQAEANWWLRVVLNIEASVRLSGYIQNGMDNGARHARDSLMAENVRSLIARNPERKTILWCNNYHCIKEMTALRYKAFTGAKPVAQRLAEKGLPVYSIATTAALGTYGQCNQTARTQVFYSSEKCLEYLLMTGGPATALLDFHGDTTSLSFQMSAARYVPVKGAWPKVYDALVFVKYEGPTTLNISNAQAERKSRNKKTIGLYGEVIDADTKAHIPYAAIKLGGTVIGAISNADGEFVLKIPEDKVTTGYIQVTALGYTDIALQAASAITYDTLVLKLRPKEVGIQPIGISAKYRELTPAQIVRRAISRLDDNFQQDPLLMELYYRRTRRDQSDTLYSEEALMDVFDANGNKRRGERSLRQERNYRINLIRRSGWEGWQGNLKGTLGEIFRQDLACRKHNVLSNKRLAFYTLEVEGITTMDGTEVFVIRYTCKKPSVYTTGEEQVDAFSGKLYIAAEDFAVVRHDADIVYDVRVSTTSGNEKYASLTRNRHLVYLYQSDGEHYCLRYAGQREIKSYVIDGRLQKEEYISEIRLVKMEQTGKKGFRGRWQDLDPTEARSDEKQWATWITNSLIDDWGLE